MTNSCMIQYLKSDEKPNLYPKFYNISMQYTLVSNGQTISLTTKEQTRISTNDSWIDD